MKSTVIVLLAIVLIPAMVNTTSYTAGLPLHLHNNHIPLVRSTRSLLHSNRKLLREGRRSRNTEELERIGTSCSGDDIVVSQGQTSPLPNHIPTYTVHITNICSTGCVMYGIHLKCGWFSSTQLINPKIFRRIGYNDCLVNDGRTIVAGGSVSFQYSNTFSYPMEVSAFACGTAGAKHGGLD